MSLATAQKSTRRKYAQRIALRISGAIAAMVFTWFFLLPANMGGFNTFTIVSGRSMEPTFHTGDLVIARPASSYKPGDVVIYKIPDPDLASYRIVHRIDHQNSDGRYAMRGDNQKHTDPWLLTKGDILGEQVLSLAKGGYILANLRNPLFLALVFGGFVTYAAWPSKKALAFELEEQPGDVNPSNSFNREGTDVGTDVETRKATSLAPPVCEVDRIESNPEGDSDLDRLLRTWVGDGSQVIPSANPSPGLPKRASTRRR
jgi:signal peptidase I